MSPATTPLNTSIADTLKASMALVSAVRTIAPTEENTKINPGWKIIRPSSKEMEEIRQVQVLEGLEHSDIIPCMLPQGWNNVLMVEAGQVALYDADDHVVGELTAGEAPLFITKEDFRWVRALKLPTTVLLVSYRKHTDAAGGLS